MRRLIALLLVLPLLGAAPAPRRIVSLNLCADQYLLALADRRQIAALTRLATDPRMSAGAAAAAGFPTSRGSAEDVLALHGDLLIATSGHRRDTVRALRGYKVAALDLEPADNYAAIAGQTRAVAAAIGHPDRGEALVRRMDAALARLPRPAGRPLVAAYYQRRGFLTGTGTLIDELMHRAGLVNLAARLGKPALARLSLEELALARPDVLIVDSGTDRVRDQGTEMLHHPLLGHIPRIKLPQAWTVCGGPAYVRAAYEISRQARALSS